MQMKQIYNTDLSLKIVITKRVVRHHLSLSRRRLPRCVRLIWSAECIGELSRNKKVGRKSQIKMVLPDLDDIYLEFDMCKDAYIA